MRRHSAMMIDGLGLPPIDITSKDKKEHGLDLPKPDLDGSASKSHFTKSTEIKEHHFYITDGISVSEEWYQSFLNLINSVDKQDIVNIHLNSYGGSVYAALQIITTLQRCNALKLNLFIEGECSSAATLIAFGVPWDKLEIQQYSIFLFHNGSTLYWGKPSDICSNNKSYMKLLEKMFNDYYKVVLTEEEIHQVIHDGLELFLHGDDVVERLEKSKAEQAKASKKKTKKA